MVAIGVFEGGGAKRGIVPPKPFLAPLRIFNDSVQTTDNEVIKIQFTYKLLYYSCNNDQGIMQ